MKKGAGAGCGCVTAIVAVFIMFQIIGIIADAADLGSVLGFGAMIIIAMPILFIVAIILIVRVIVNSSRGTNTSAGRTPFNTGNPGSYQYSRPQQSAAPTTVNYYYQTAKPEQPAAPSYEGENSLELAEASARVRFCRNCGGAVEPTDKFCPYCGQKL